MRCHRGADQHSSVGAKSPRLLAGPKCSGHIQRTNTQFDELIYIFWCHEIVLYRPRLVASSYTLTTINTLNTLQPTPTHTAELHKNERRVRLRRQEPYQDDQMMALQRLCYSVAFIICIECRPRLIEQKFPCLHWELHWKDNLVVLMTIFDLEKQIKPLKVYV